MSSFTTDRIKPSDKGINTYLEELTSKNYQIPTFQRKVVWDRENVKKLWDSVYKFYPLGSILIWKTGIKLQNHRSIGGHLISDGLSRDEYQYILDGQQRTTSLLTSLYGGKLEGRGDFDPTLYVDITVADKGETDNKSYKERFLFWSEIDDRGGELRKNTKRKKRFDKGLIFRLIDVKQNFGEIERKLVNNGYSDYDHKYREQLRKIKEVIDNYRISFIELKGIKVAEVCQIFERINQEGRPLNIFDIVVAKTFRPEKEDKKGFYLRDLIDRFKEETQGNFAKIDDLTYLQILSVLIRQKFPESKVINITDRYLNEIKAKQIEDIWEESKTVLLKLFDFFENHLHLKGPGLIPYRYFYMTLATYFFKNPNPDYEFIKKYFWYNSFHNDDLLSNTTQLWNDVIFLKKGKKSRSAKFERFLIDKNKLRTSSYSSKGRLSRAILSLYANKEPKDWRITDRSVISEVYYLLTDKPSLHHVFPLNFISNNSGKNKLDGNSLMNIVYLTQITNLKISDRNPISYIRDFDRPEFEEIMSNHLLPAELLTWSRSDKMPEDALDLFIEKRADLIIEDLEDKLTGINFEVIDTKESTDIPFIVTDIKNRDVN